MDLHFLEIGTADFDTFIQTCHDDTVGVSVEPVKFYLDRLPNKPNVIKVHAAVSDADGTADVYYLKPDLLDAHNMPFWLRGCNSIQRPHALVVENVVSRGLSLDGSVARDTVLKFSFPTLARKYNMRTIEHLKTDTEGHDLVILTSYFQFCIQYAPELLARTILFETNECTATVDQDKCIEMFKRAGYRVQHRGERTCLERHWVYEHFAYHFPAPVDDDDRLGEAKRIPRVLHIIWVGDREEPPTFEEHARKWAELMPHWQIKTWRNKDVHGAHFDAAELACIHNAPRGVSKADIMRYLIVRKYGGVYIDADVVPCRPLDNCIPASADAVFCNDLAVTCWYMSCAFFAATPDHPVFITARELAFHADVEHVDVHLHTGPRLLGRAIESAKPPAESRYALLPVRTLYWNTDNPARFGLHTYAGQWS